MKISHQLFSKAVISISFMLSSFSAYSGVSSANALCDVDVKNFSAIGNALADDTLAIRNAVLKASQLTRPTLCFPASNGYRVTDTITIPTGISVVMNSSLLFDGDSNTPALVIGDSNTSNKNLILQLDVKKVTQSNWLNEASVGIKFYNLHSSSVHIRRSELFTIGIQAIGANAKGFGYNKVELGWITGNKIGLDITNETGGWSNENIFINGRFGQYSSPNIPSDRIGIRITSSDGVYKNNNSNLFIKPAFELWESFSGGGEALPVLIEHGLFNSFESCRNEQNSLTFARVLNNSRSNEFDIAYGDVGNIDDQSVRPTSYAVTRENRILSSVSAPGYISGSLAQIASPYNSAGYVHIPGVHTTNASGNIFKAMNDFVIAEKYIEMPWPKGLGVFVDTSRQKQLVIRKEVVEGFGGRVAIRAYDSSGNVLDGDSASLPYVSGNQGYYWSTSFKGAYLLSADSDQDFYLNLRNEVDKIGLLFLGGTTNPLRLKSFSVSALKSGAPSVWSGYKSAIPGANISSEAPTHHCEVGQIIYNDDPSISIDPSENEPIGWVCTSNTGVWNGFGKLL